MESRLVYGVRPVANLANFISRGDSVATANATFMSSIPITIESSVLVSGDLTIRNSFSENFALGWRKTLPALLLKIFNLPTQQ